MKGKLYLSFSNWRILSNMINLQSICSVRLFAAATWPLRWLRRMNCHMDNILAPTATKGLDKVDSDWELLARR